MGYEVVVLAFSSEDGPIWTMRPSFVSRILTASHDRTVRIRCSCSYGPTGSLSAESKIAQPFGPSRKLGRSRLKATAAALYAAAVMMILAKRRQECCVWLLAGLGREELGFCGHGPPTSPTAVDHWRRSRFEQGPCKSIMGASRSRSPRTLPRSFRQQALISSSG